jgi:hypothetical protein
VLLLVALHEEGNLRRKSATLRILIEPRQEGAFLYGLADEASSVYSLAIAAARLDLPTAIGPSRAM